MKKYFSLAILYFLFLAACTQINLFEKNVAIPKHRWEASFKPDIRFDITDTTAFYNIYLVIRHTEAYSFNNIWVRIQSKSPGDSAYIAQQFDLPLASENRWTGTGMDDLFEHRILLYPQPVKFRKAGEYEVIIEHLMRENPLEHVLNVGLRVEKVKSL